DFVARQGFEFMGRDLEFKFEARNLLRRDYREYQELGPHRIYFNRLRDDKDSESYTPLRYAGRMSFFTINDIEMTGQVLPIGGVKEKSLAAQRAGIKMVILPERNEGDVEEIPEHERSELDFAYVDTVGEAVSLALGGR
ncbi:MAG: S16 family serine protease, partial [Ilumatobacteraceae bacterium]